MQARHAIRYRISYAKANMRTHSKLLESEIKAAVEDRDFKKCQVLQTQLGNMMKAQQLESEIEAVVDDFEKHEVARRSVHGALR